MNEEVPRQLCSESRVGVRRERKGVRWVCGMPDDGAQGMEADERRGVWNIGSSLERKVEAGDGGYR